MSVSQKLNKLIELYINDAQDYYENTTLVEETLSPIAKLMQEENANPESALKEALAKASPDQKDILLDFILYTKNI